MDVSAGIKASLAGRYASALFDLASEAGTVTAVESDLETLAGALRESPELRALIRNPEVSREALGRVLAGLGKSLKLADFAGLESDSLIPRGWNAFYDLDRGVVQEIFWMCAVDQHW